MLPASDQPIWDRSEGVKDAAKVSHQNSERDASVSVFVAEWGLLEHVAEQIVLFEWGGGFLGKDLLVWGKYFVIVKVERLEQVEYPVVVEGDLGLLNLDILLYYPFILKNIGLVVASIKNFVVVIVNIRVKKLVHHLGCNHYILNIFRVGKRLTVLLFGNMLQVSACVHDDSKHSHR